ncbi:MAG: hypothetical protein RBG13Loki_3049 [Promethearchaeota archaeon CR_4]|nr:MAG: hypothetical protein RBG13Loki_3049 [Candidatus Lokiarchaeota archaeon CR_4]
MKFILDENIPSNIKQMLRNAGHEALDLEELQMLSAKNGEVGNLTIEQNAILVTLDKDFTHMKREIKERIRVIYIHIHPPNPPVAEKILQSKLSFCLNKLRRPGVVTLETVE